MEGRCQRKVVYRPSEWLWNRPCRHPATRSFSKEESLSRRIDAHQHFWRYSPEDHAWIDDRMARLRRDFLPADLAPELAQAQMDGSVAVQARQSLEETRFLVELKQAHSEVLGVVGWVDLCAESVGAELEELGGELVGVRHLVQDEPDDEFLLREDFRRGIGHLAGTGLIYELLIHPRHLVVAKSLVAEFPEQPFVLDHMAKPYIARDEIRPWADHLRALAQHDNVSCKLSGLVTEARWDDWTLDDLVPYLDVALDCFGIERVMFGSDWPVCLLASPDYRTTLGVLDVYGERLGVGERNRLFGENAARIYGL